MSAGAGDKVIEELERVIRDVEALLKITAGQFGEKVADSADSADTHVRSHPWASVGVALAAGVLVGLLLGRRSGNSP